MIISIIVLILVVLFFLLDHYVSEVFDVHAP
jgi:hypothetical protein